MSVARIPGGTCRGPPEELGTRVLALFPSSFPELIEPQLDPRRRPRDRRRLARRADLRDV